ncbi:Hsp70 family protein [Hymenobacter taeanensis]|uniref:Hsp70 family protein n=1 Tax=Hymenobacter taeanensis TaxID=2735321 RepID=A0A6M6BI91_9BACT|nr:Hsp70 family protein [Hymenobacter taeanensis]QJX47826.1 Hsp70 family protein [Hymenobacter taeanensis]
MKNIIGIDLGTTNSVVAFKTRDVEVLRNRENEELTRSCVALRNEEILVGKHAYNMLGANPQNTIVSVKRLMGGAINDPMVQDMLSKKNYYQYGIVPMEGGTSDAVAVVMGGRQYTPEQISAEILKKLKADAEEKLNGEVTHAVITVPAYFTEKQKNATRLAASYAGLKVLRLLAEPTAAAIAYGVDNTKAGELSTVVVYDFGGGTFDLSVLNIVDRECLEMGAGGDRWLGGDDLDQALHNYVFKKVEQEYGLSSLQDLVDNLPDKKRHKFLFAMRSGIKQIKVDLSSSQSQSLLIEDLLEDEDGNAIDIDLTITRAEFEKIIRPFVERTVALTEELLNQMSYTPDMIDAFLLVGGSSCIPLVRQLMAERFGVDKVKVGKKPMLAIAEGAAMLAQSMGETYECPNCGAAVPQSASKCPSCDYNVAAEVKERGVGEVTLTTKHDLYMMVTDRHTGLERPERLFEKQTPMPASTSRIFRTSGDQQRLMKVDVQSDVEGGRRERQTFGFATIEENLPAGSEFVFDFALSADETISCKVYPKGYSNKAKQVILGRGQKDEEALQSIDKMIDDFNAGEFSANQSQQLAEALLRYLRVAESIGNDKGLDTRWPELRECVWGDYYRITEPSNDENTDTMLAEIYCASYPQLIEPNDLRQMRALIPQAKVSGIAGAQAREQLTELVDGYWSLLSLAFIKLASNEATTLGSPDGSRIRSLHDQAVACFERGDRNGAFSTMEEAEVLANKYMDKGTIGKTVSKNIIG